MFIFEINNLDLKCIRYLIQKLEVEKIELETAIKFFKRCNCTYCKNALIQIAKNSKHERS